MRKLDGKMQSTGLLLLKNLKDVLIYNCRSHYTPNENLTVYEQLFPTKYRCRFTQHMPQKSDKYEIKIWTLAEVDSQYLLNAIPYMGKDDDVRPKESKWQWNWWNNMKTKVIISHLTNSFLLCLWRKVAGGAEDFVPENHQSWPRRDPENSQTACAMLTYSFFICTKDGKLLTCYQKKEQNSETSLKCALKNDAKATNAVIRHQMFVRIVKDQLVDNVIPKSVFSWSAPLARIVCKLLSYCHQNLWFDETKC